MNSFKNKNHLNLAALILGTTVAASILLGYDGVITVEVRPVSVRIVLGGNHRHDHPIDLLLKVNEQHNLQEKSTIYLALPKKVMPLIAS